MILFKRVKIRSYEVGLHFRDGEFKGLLSAGRYWLFDPLFKGQVDMDGLSNRTLNDYLLSTGAGIARVTAAHAGAASGSRSPSE